MQPDTLIFYDDLMVRHDPGRWHPERPERLVAVRDRLRARPIAGTRWASPTPASRDLVARVHEPALLDALERYRGQRVQLDPDTAMSEDSFDAALLAAGAAIDAAEAVVRGVAPSALALVRPPGHHAEAARPMGFCLFNNIAVAAAHAVAELGCERVLVVDWDVHHGNGTQHAFEDRRDVLFFSTHRYPFYPGTGALHEVGRGAGEGYTVNVPFGGGQSDADYLRAFREVLVPIAEAYRPELVLVSAGFDAHRLDPLGGMRLSGEGYAALCGVVADLADRFADGRLVLLLEGGYDLQGLSESVDACLRVMRGETPPEPSGPSRQADDVVRDVRDVFGRWWTLD